MRPGEDSDSARLVDLGMRLLGHLHRGTNVAPVVLGARVRNDALEFFVRDGGPPPSPYICRDDRWCLERTPEVTELLERASSHPPVLPALVSVGSDEDGMVLLNLEAGGIVAIEGEQNVAEQIVLAMAIELASCTWRDSLDLFALGIDEGIDLDRIARVDRLSELHGQIHAQVLAQRHNLEEAGQPSAQQARLLVPDERLCPVVVLSARPVEDEEVEGLGLPEDPARMGVALVVAGAAEQANWRLAIDAEGRLEIPALRTRVTPHRLGPKSIGAIEALLHLACEERDVGVDEPPYDAITAAFFPEARADQEESARDGRPTGEDELPQASAPDPHIDDTPEDLGLPQTALSPEDQPEEAERECLLLIGPTELRGATSERSGRTKVMELVGWLVLHPQGASLQQVALILWPDKDVSEHYVWNIVRHARRLLPPGPNGQPRITRWGKLRIEPPLETDWERFVQLSRSEVPDKWFDALSLLRGAPFSDVDWPWAVVEGIVSHMSEEILDIACRSATWALEHDDPKRAAWAVEQGLLLGETAKYDQRLWRLMMQAAARLGGLQALRSVMDRLHKALDDDLDQLELVENETQQLYEDLVRCSASARISSTPEVQ